MKNGSKIYPEYRTTKRVRGAGFVPSFDEQVVEVWQVWCKSTDGNEERRATYGDLRSAGLKKRKKNA